MNIEFSVSNLRNELYVYNQNNDHLLFTINGFEIDEDFTRMSNHEIEMFITNNYQEVIYDLI